MLENSGKKVQFYLCCNETVEKLTRDASKIMPLVDDFRFRTRAVLQHKLSVLENVVNAAQKSADNDPSLLPIVIGGEDFFEGGSVSTKSEEQLNKGQCMSRDTVYRFFQNEMRELSARYPNVLIIPGSIYTSVKKLSNDNSIYSQDNRKDYRADLYVQNVMPIFYGGDWLRLVKKGAPLMAEDKSLIKDEETFEERAEEGEKIRVTAYAEDELTDINKNLVFFGETPLPGESVMLGKYAQREDFFSPIIEINGLKIGMEICHDHDKKKLVSEGHTEIGELDVHIISSLGVGYAYTAALDKGYRVQVDAREDSSNAGISIHSCYDSVLNKPETQGFFSTSKIISIPVSQETLGKAKELELQAKQESQASKEKANAKWQDSTKQDEEEMFNGFNFDNS